ncbi:GNAT family N-acetyltransferase [Sphingomonas aracearum]|uniref:GNAT family N-acetyltransferase n=1 Tax=Sphingomonas aracearum TaxID=2283317 RepID=UPI0015F0C7D8|nr:GNAT family N-acetyltransferase [Sphingomonas aracearum]
MFARTPRLTLRPGWPEDAPALARAIAHEAVIEKLARAPWPYALGDAEAFLALPRGAAEPRFLVLSHEADYPAIVGGIAIDRTGDGGAEFGYWFAPQAWGRGYATEAGRIVIDMARHALGLRRLDACHHLDNPASGRVLTKLGFRPTGAIEQRPSLGRGGDVPCVLFELDLSGAGDEVRMAA